MKLTTVLILSCSLGFSCNNKKEKVSPVATIDTTAAIKPENPIAIGSNTTYSPIDVSPMDMSYHPADYPKLKMSKPATAPPLARVVYSRPHLQGRQLFHDVLKYGEPWRLGANEATELDLYTDATIQGNKIKAGRYILYCIPEKDTWTIVLNSNIDSWGLHPDPTGDIAKFIVPIIKTGNSLEYFTMIFLPTAAGADLLMAWANVEAKLPITF